MIEVGASKSILNRLQIVRSFFPELQIVGDSQCDDVLELRQALADFERGEKSFHLGLGATSLRFFTLRLSRTVGNYHVSFCTSFG